MNRQCVECGEFKPVGLGGVCDTCWAILLAWQDKAILWELLYAKGQITSQDCPKPQPPVLNAGRLF